VLEAVRLSEVPAPAVVVASLAVLAAGGLGLAVAAILLAGRRAPGDPAAAAAAPDPPREAAEAPAPAGS
jgi:hypothetical protein